jgi:hypothetical protein
MALTDYDSYLEVIEAETQRAHNIFSVLSAINDHRSALLMPPKKMDVMSPEVVYGVQTAVAPHMGRTVRLRADMILAMHATIVTDLLMREISDDIDIVFEIGSGTGSQLMNLALRNPYPHIQFYGGELSESGRNCLSRFIDISGLANVHSLPFDIQSPDFSMLSGKRALVFTHAVLTAVNPLSPHFLDSALSAAASLRGWFMEGISYQLAQDFPVDAPLATRMRADLYGFGHDLWKILKSLEQSGRIVIDEVIPDLSGPSFVNPLSLVTFTSK